MKKILIAMLIALLGVVNFASAQSTKGKILFDCIGCEVTTKAECDDCGTNISASSFTGIRVRRNGRVLKELHFPFEVHRSGSKVCIEELGDNRETYCVGRGQTLFGSTRAMFDSLYNLSLIHI